MISKLKTVCCFSFIILCFFYAHLPMAFGAEDPGGGTLNENVWVSNTRVKISSLDLEKDWRGYYDIDETVKTFLVFGVNNKDKYSPNTNYILKMSTGNNTFVWLVVPKDNPLKGTIGSAPLVKKEITLKTGTVSPPGISITTRGKLAGKIIETGKWASDFAAVMKKGRISLYRQSTPEPDLVYINDKAALKPDENGYFSVDINSIVGGGLPDGDYVLAFYHSEKATSDGCIDCGLGWNLWGSESEYSGDVSFRLERINTYDPIKDSQDLRGYGKITLTIASDEEKKSPVTTTKISEPEKGFFIEVGEGQKNTLMSAFRDALIFVSDSISFMMGTISKWINQSINESADINNQVLRNVAKNIRNISLSLLTLGLLIIAFANILNIQVEQYGLTKMIPKFVIGIVFSYFSYFIAMFLLSLMGALQALMLSFISQNGIADINFNPAQLLGITGDYTFNPLTIFLNSTSMIFQAVFFIIIMIISLIIFVWLWLIMIVRKAMLMILVAVAPLAFIAMIMPFTEKYYKQWWATFWKWAFIGPAVMFMLLLSKLFMESWFASSFTSSGMDPANADSWIYLVVYTVFIFMAATIPLKMGNEIYGKIKDGWNKSGKLPVIGTPKRMLDERSKAVANRRSLKARMTMAKIAQTGAAGRAFAGLTEKEAEARKIELLKSMGEIAPEGRDGIKAALAKTRVGSLEEQSLIYKAASTGNLDPTDERQRDAVLKYANPTDKENYIPGLEKIVGKENADFEASALIGKFDAERQTWVAPPDARFAANAAASISRIPPKERKKAHWEAIPDASYASIAQRASTVKDALAGRDDAAEAFAIKMTRTGAVHSITDTDLKRDVLSRAAAARVTPPPGPAEPTQNQPRIQPATEADVRREVDNQRTGGGQPPADGTPPTNSAPPASNL